MARSTIADIARRAGVSTATVDRALNARPGVSAANRQRVLQAARALGYLPTEGMVPLPARPAHLEFLIPFGRSSFMHDLGEAIERFAAALPLVASCRITPLGGIGPAALESALGGLSLRTGGVGLVAVDEPATRRAIARLCEAGVRVVTIASDVGAQGRSAYVGIDNHMAGRTAAHLMGLAARRGQVALFLGSKAFHGHREREAGFREVLARFPDLTILPGTDTGEDSRRSRPAMAEMLRADPKLAGVYCVGSGRAGIAEALREARCQARGPFTIVHELTQSSRGWLVEGVVDAVIDQNARVVGQQAVIRLLGSIAAAAPLLPERDVEARLIFRENLPPA